MAAPGQLFRSEHVDDRLGLAAVQRLCSVALLPPGQAPPADAASGAACAYSCQLQLDHEQMTLAVLPPGCLPGGGA